MEASQDTRPFPAEVRWLCGFSGASASVLVPKGPEREQVEASQMVTHRMEQVAAKGERLVARLVGQKPTNKLAPFDVVDFGDGYAYEVKTVSKLALTGSNKIHIEAKAWERKHAFLAEYGLEGVLMVVVVASRDDVAVYRVPLRQHLRISTVVKTGTRIA